MGILFSSGMGDTARGRIGLAKEQNFQQLLRGLEQVQSAVQHGPQQACQLLLGLAYLRSDDCDKAAALFLAGLGALDKFSQADQHTKEACAAGLSLCSNDPHHIAAIAKTLGGSIRLQLCIAQILAFVKTEKFEGAVAACEAALSHFPGDPHLINMHAMCLIALPPQRGSSSNSETATKDLQALLTSDPSS